MIETLKQEGDKKQRDDSQKLEQSQQLVLQLRSALYDQQTKVQKQK